MSHVGCRCFRRGYPSRDHVACAGGNRHPLLFKSSYSVKLLVALLFAKSVEGLDTKKQVALKKPLLLRGGAFGPKKALLAQTAGLTVFGTEFILAKCASTRYFVRASRYTCKPHNRHVTHLRAQCRGLA